MSAAAPVPAALVGLYQWAEKLEYSAFGTAIAESRYAFAIIEALHLFGLAAAVGFLLLVDLRLLGFAFRSQPVPRLLAQLRPWIIGGFALVFVTGVLLFWSSAARMVANPAFAIKLGLILLAGINALYFELSVGRSLAVRSGSASSVAVPLAAQVAGAASIGLWSLVIVFGRLIPYLPSWLEGVMP